jgi:hypothetical protein
MGPGSIDLRSLEEVVSRALLIVWIATMGADRIDLLGGSGPLMLRPVLVLIPPMLVLELLRLGHRDRTIVFPPAAAIFFVAHTLLLGVLLLSVMYSQEVGLGLQRFALIAFESYAAFLGVIFLTNRPDTGRIMLQGAQLGLLLIALFDLIQVSRWSGGPGFDWLSFGGIIDLAPATYGPWVPRPSGVSLDPNRGGLLVIVYMYLVAALAPASRGRSALVALGVALLVVTLSRSAILAALAVAAFSLLRRRVRASSAGVAGTSLAIAAVAAATLVSPAVQQALVGATEVLGHRLSLGEESSSMHLALQSRGWEISTESVRNALLGIGFGNSFLVLQDFFPGTKYGNFHSAYVSLLVEGGVGAMVGFLVLLFRPLLQPSAVRPLIVGLIAFNVFYQSHVDAILWFVLTLAWVLPELAQERAPVGPTAAALEGEATAGASDLAIADC